MARTFALMLLVGLSVTSAPVVHGQCTSTTKPTAVFSSGFGTTEVFWNGGCTYTVSVHVTGSSSNIVDIRPVVDGQIIANLNILNDSGGGNLQVRVLRSADNTKTFGGLNSMPWDNRNMRPIALTTLYTSGNVGTLEVNSVNDNSLNNIIVGGNLGAITIKPDPSPPPQASQVVSLQVSGNITGNIVNPYGSIKRLLVTGDMGTTGTPINIWAKTRLS